MKMNFNSQSTAAFVAGTDDSKDDSSRQTVNKKGGGIAEKEVKNAEFAEQTKSGKLLNEQGNKNQDEDATCMEDFYVDHLIPIQEAENVTMLESSLLTMDPEETAADDDMKTDPPLSSMEGREEPSLKKAWNENRVDDHHNHHTNLPHILDDKGIAIELDQESSSKGKTNSVLVFNATGNMVQESKRELSSSSPTTDVESAGASSTSPPETLLPPPIQHIRASSDVEDHDTIDDNPNQRIQVYDPGFDDLMLEPLEEADWSASSVMMIPEDTLAPHDPSTSPGSVGSFAMQRNSTSSNSFIRGGSKETVAALPSTPNVIHDNHQAELPGAIFSDNSTTISPEAILSLMLAPLPPEYDEVELQLMNGRLVSPIPLAATSSSYLHGVVMPHYHAQSGGAIANLMVAPTLQQQVVSGPTTVTARSVQRRASALPCDTRSATMVSGSGAIPAAGENMPQAAKAEASRRAKQKRFQEDQTEIWTTRLQEAVQFRTQHGHCSIPCEYPANQSLATWAKRQRHQYYILKRLMMQKYRHFENAATVDSSSIAAFVSSYHDDDDSAKVICSTMTAERIVALESIGFCWESRASRWSSRFQELQLYVQTYGNANVVQKRWGRKLFNWVKCQRHQYKKWLRNERSNMTRERAMLLASVGFDFRIKS